MATSADMWALLLMIAGCTFLWWLADRLADHADQVFLRRLVIATYSVRGVWSIAQHLIFPEIWPMVAADARYRYALALDRTAMWREGLWRPAMPLTLQEAHTAVVDLKSIVLMYLFGDSPMLPEFFTITLNVSTVIAVYLIARRIGALPVSARAAAAITALLPSLVFWSTQDLKDPVTATCVTWSVYAMINLGRGGAVGYLMLLAAADAGCLLYRPYVGILLIVGQGMAWAYTVKLPATPAGQFTRIALFVTAVPIALHFGVQEMQATYGEQGSVEWAAESFETFREIGTAAGDVRGSEYAIPLSASSTTEALLQLPLRVLLLVLSPIPLFRGTLIRMASYPEMWFIYLFVVPRFYYGLGEIWRRNRLALITLLLVVGPIIAAYGLKTAISGEAIRMRTQFLPVLLVIAGVGHGVLVLRRAAGGGAQARRGPRLAARELRA